MKSPVSIVLRHGEALFRQRLGHPFPSRPLSLTTLAREENQAKAFSTPLRVPQAAIDSFCQSGTPTMQRYRSRAINSLPFLAYAINPASQAEHALFGSIDTGTSAKEAVKDYFNRPHWATNYFLQQAALAPSLDALRHVGEMLSHDLTAEVRFDSATYGSRVALLPSPAERNMTEIMWENATLLRCRYDATTAAHLFINSSRDWVKNHQSLLKLSATIDQKDIAYFKSITEDILFPAYLAQLEKAYQAHDQALPDYETSPTHVNALQAQATQRLSAFLSPAKLQAHTERWYDKQFIINARKAALTNRQPPQEQPPEWHGLIPDLYHEGNHYKTLTSQAALSREAEEMHHCVAGFARVCKTGETHIIAGRTAAGQRFTLEIGQKDGLFTQQQL